MSLSAAAMRLLADLGVSVDDIIAVAAANEAERLAPDAAERKRIRDRERMAAKRDNERQSRDKGDTDSRSAEATKGDIGATVAPLAHVRDKPLPTEISGLAVAVAETRDERANDDWPKADASAWCSLLVELAAAAKLDHHKSPGLIQTLGTLARWKKGGASWEFDVVPTVVSLAKRKTGPPIANWKYFDGAIAQSVADNRQALTLPEAKNVRQFPRKSDRDDRLGRMLAGAVAATDGA